VNLGFLISRFHFPQNKCRSNVCKCGKGAGNTIKAYSRCRGSAGGVARLSLHTFRRVWRGNTIICGVSYCRPACENHHNFIHATLLGSLQSPYNASVSFSLLRPKSATENDPLEPYHLLIRDVLWSTHLSGSPRPNISLYPTSNTVRCLLRPTCLFEGIYIITNMSTKQEIIATINALLPASIETFPIISTLIGVLVSYGLYRLLSIGSRDKRMPPGPPTLPILGNLHQIPVTGMYKKFVLVNLC